MCGFIKINVSTTVIQNIFEPEWAKNYSNGISNNCVIEGRQLAIEDFDNSKYSCNSFGYHWAYCVFEAVNELYDAYMGCQELIKFKRIS